MTTARSYHIYTASLYCLGFVGIYLVRVGIAVARLGLWRGGCGDDLPFFLFLSFLPRCFAGSLMPVRLGVLIRYGEGPHMSALALLPFALAAAWWGLRRGTTAFLAARRFLRAGGLEQFLRRHRARDFLPGARVGGRLAEHERLVCLRAAAMAVLAWGLTAFWLTPSYLQVTLET